VVADGHRAELWAESDALWLRVDHLTRDVWRLDDWTRARLDLRGAFAIVNDRPTQVRLANASRLECWLGPARLSPIRPALRSYASDGCELSLARTNRIVHPLWNKTAAGASRLFALTELNKCTKHW